MFKKIIPDELKNQPYWVNWKRVDGSKVPCSPSGFPISVTKPQNYLTYDQACDAISKDDTLGLGFVFHESNGYMGVDLDYCLDENKKLSPQMEKILEGYNGMLEISPSDKGLKLIVRGKKPEKIKSKIDGTLFGATAIEWYDQGRFFTVTGNSYNGSTTIEDGSVLAARLLPHFTSNSTRRPTFSKPTHSGGYAVKNIGSLDSQSEQDFRLCMELAEEYPFDTAMVDGLFRNSELMRPKWDEIHSGDGRTYGQMTINSAFEYMQLKGDWIHRKYLAYAYEFRRNTVFTRIEFRRRGNGEFIHLSDPYLNSILGEIRTRGGNISATTLLEIINTPDMAPDYDPIQEFLRALPKWDGTDYLGQLCACLDTSDNTLRDIMIKRWLLGMMATVLRGKVNQGCLVLKGVQGLGKTSFIAGLIPEELREFYYSGTIREESKDTLMLMVGKMVINMDELANLQRRETSMLKELITKEEISFRMPYERTVQQHIRRASFIGSVNNASFLGDETGTRRFWVLDCSAIRWQKMPDIKKVYAQLLDLLDSGERWWMDATDQQRIEDHNALFKLPSTELDLLEEHATGCNHTDMTITQIHTGLSRISGVPPQQINKNKLRQALDNLGYTSVRKQGATRFKIKILPNFNL